MRNYIQPGDVLDLVAPYDVPAGGGALIGDTFGVAVNAVLSGAIGQFKTSGVFDLPKTAANTPAVGAKLYWDNAAKSLTTTASTNKFVATQAATAASGGSDPTVRARLNGVAV